MIEILVSIILLPFAIVAAAFTIALGVGILKHFFENRKDF